MANKRCVACGKHFRNRPQSPNQTYCAEPSCQRERRQKWQLKKLKVDADYRDNKSRAQANWTQKNPDYWRQYRQSHPEYVESNRLKQRERNAARDSSNVAKTDVSAVEFPIISGTYCITLIAVGAVAKKDACTVEIRAISVGDRATPEIVKIGLDP